MKIPRRFSLRPDKRSSRGHVRRARRTLPVWLVAAVGLVGIVALGVLVRAVFFSGDEATGRVYHNRTWLTQEWTVNAPERPQVEALVERLRQNNIDVVYVETGAWRQDLSYVPHPFAEDLRAMLADVDPDIQVLVWVWADENVYPNSDSHAALAAYIETAITEWGYDGVHLQGFTVFDGSENYVRMVRALDAVTSAHNGRLSITAPPDRRPADPDVPVGGGNTSTSWGPRYKQQLGLIVDEMVIMAHSSGLDTPEDYQAWLAYQVAIYAEDVRRVNSDTELIIAIPTYPASDLHDPIIENVETAIAGAQDGLRRAGQANDMLLGAGMYTYRDASSRDWILFQEAWAQ